MVESGAGDGSGGTSMGESGAGDGSGGTTGSSGVVQGSSGTFGVRPKPDLNGEQGKLTEKARVKMIISNT